MHQCFRPRSQALSRIASSRTRQEFPWVSRGARRDFQQTHPTLSRWHSLKSARNVASPCVRVASRSRVNLVLEPQRSALAPPPFTAPSGSIFPIATRANAVRRRRARDSSPPELVIRRIRALRQLGGVVPHSASSLRSRFHITLVNRPSARALTAKTVRSRVPGACPDTRGALR